MRPLRPFNWFVQENIVQKQSPNIARAKALFDEANRRQEARAILLAATPIIDVLANTYLENAYDELLALTRAIMLAEGCVARGEGAHEAEVAYLVTIHVPETSVRLLNTLRASRNGVLYYGENASSEYAEQAVTLAQTLGPLLRAECTKRGIA